MYKVARARVVLSTCGVPLNYVSAGPRNVLDNRYANLQVRKCPFEVEREWELDAGHIVAGDFICFRLCGAKRVERPDHLSIEEKLVPGALGLNHESVAVRHTRPPLASWPATGRCGASC